jgi:hypothetical protein
MAYSAEYEPITTMKELLEDNWIPYLECPTPIFVIANDEDDPYSRIDLNLGDHVVLRTDGSEVIKYRGNIQYYDKEYPITLDVFTKENRQRLKDIWKQVRAICFLKKWDFTGYQLVLINSYTEMVNEQLNIWRAEIKLRVTAAGVCADTVL